MKKIISVLLLLAMCVACFAGCTPAEEGNDGLAAAKEYLYTMYKDEAEATGADYVVVGAVMIDGVSYSVTWTVDNDTVKVVPGDNKMVTIKIPEPTEEDVAYNLTATITDAEGKTETVTFAHKIPGAEKVAESVVLYFPDAEQYITGTDYIYTSSSGSQKHELTLSANKADAVPLTVRENDDGTVTFIAEGKFLFCDATNVQFVATEDDNTKFVLEATEGGYFIKCAVANYGGKAQYLEVYSGYLTCYGMNAEKANIYTFKLEDSTGASGVLKDAATETPDEEPEEKPEESKPADKPEDNTPPAGTKVNVVTAPAVGTAYKFHLFHATNGADMFLTGNTANKDYYLESTTDASAAIDVYLETAEGGYYLYFTKDGAKTYIDIIVSGTYINIKLATAPGAVYTWNTEYNTLTTTVDLDGEPTGAYIGAYGTYSTFSASKASYMGGDGSFCANLVTVG